MGQADRRLTDRRLTDPQRQPGGEVPTHETGNRTAAGPDSPTAPVIRTERLSRRFTVGRRRQRDTIDAVRDLTLTVTRGERLAFIGPNGAGKSTSIKMLTGILKPSGGEVTVLGMVPWRDRRRLAARIGTLFGQRSQLWNELAPSASYRVLGAIHGLDEDDVERSVRELGRLLDATDLFDQPVRTLSLGQRMRCELAACLLHRPELLFLDEPTIGLDLLGKRAFRRLLLRINDELGSTILLTSHDAADLEHVAQRTVVVNHGLIVHDAPIGEMRRGLLALKRVQVATDRPMDATEVADRLDMTSVTVSNDPASARSLRVDVDTSLVPIREVLGRLLALVDPQDLSVVDPPLEDVIGEIYQRPADR